MSMTDPIADMLTRIRNAISARHNSVAIPGSKIKRRIAEILQEEGYIDSYEWETNSHQGELQIRLRWVTDRASAIEGLARVSTPGQRRYARSGGIPKVRDGLGVMIVSTSQGVMTDRVARKKGVGGELICSVW
ncbi:MAG: 30S ribosomal protein S8 [Myxococcales bacterium FL481]|nr:MAG: 30S ribosomal protein S8 [Myxococcales bacterium FL481]